jgi:hypothetical protein
MRKRYVYAGDEIGANVANELFAYLKNEIERRLKKQNIKGQKLKNDFRVGCILGIQKNIERLGGWRDMQEKRRRVYKKHFSNIKPFRGAATISVNKNTFLAGMESGADININRQAGVDARAGFLEGTE